MSQNRKKALVHISITLAIPLLLAVYLFLCESGLGIPCFFERNFHILCPSCGATRAFQQILRLDFAGAVAYNGFFALGIYPILFVIYLQDLILTLLNLLRNENRTTFLFFLFRSKEAAP